MIRKPPIQDVINFITNTHLVENLPCTLSDTENTLKKISKNPYAHGHLLALNYILNTLLPSNDFPSRIIVKSLSDLNYNISWLHKIHSLIASPIVEIDKQYSLSKLGIWRLYPSQNTFTNAPPPNLLPAIMINWINNLSNIHSPIKNKISSPYGLSQSQALNLIKFAEEQTLFFSTVQPFNYDNNKMGRLIMNTLLLAWNFPINTIKTNFYEQFKQKLEIYQTKNLPTIIQSAQQLSKTI